MQLSTPKQSLISVSQTNTRIKSSAVSAWDFTVVKWSYPTDLQSLAQCAGCPLLKSSSLTVFMELCYFVSVLSYLSLRPCKEPHHSAARLHCVLTTIPELTHPSSSSMLELQIYVQDATGYQQDWMCHFGFAVFSKHLFLFVFFLLLLYNLKVKVTWIQTDLGETGSDSNFHASLFKICNSVMLRNAKVPQIHCEKALPIFQTYFLSKKES